MLGIAFLFALIAFAGADSPPAAAQWTPTDVAVGDPSVSYANIEFTSDGRYAVWFEQTTNGTGVGSVWHCAVEPDTAEFTPPDCRGFQAFTTTIWGRGNPGIDAGGPYYVGMNLAGNLLLIRPTSATTGSVSVLAAPADLTRRSIYPTDLPGQQAGYVYWIKNEQTHGPPLNPANSWFELRYLDLANPATEIVIVRQDRPAQGFAPMDVGFARWYRGKATLTYGCADAAAYVQVCEYDAVQANPAPAQVTSDPHDHVDPFPWFLGSDDILVPGLDGTAESCVYKRPAGALQFTCAESITPPNSALTDPALAQSHERAIWAGRGYTAYQVNDAGSTFFQTAFAQPGEIWLSTVLQSPQQQWRVSGDGVLGRAEPETYVGNSRVWVFYSSLPEGAGLLTGTWSLRRADTPLENCWSSVPSATDGDCDGVTNSDEVACAGNTLSENLRPERLDGPFAGAGDDGDLEVDEALPAGVAGYDCDGDGYPGTAEDSVFGVAARADQRACGLEGWPSDFISSGIPNSTNKITITDLTSFLAPVRRLDTSPGGAGFSARSDLVPGRGLFIEWINISDLTALLAGPSGFPPMLGGARAFNGPACS